jgi:hypothetical protein
MVPIAIANLILTALLILIFGEMGRPA